MKIHKIAMLLALVAAACCASAQRPWQSASGREFVRPVYQNKQVDWCLNWGTGCGKPAADYFCRLNGYGDAARFDTALMSPTLILGDKAICRTACTGFTRISCDALRSGADERREDWSGRDVPPPPPPSGRDYSDGRGVTIAVPMIGGYRVDWCVNFGMQCGQPAADMFCQRQGYAAAESFDRRMVRPTMVMGANQLCMQADCTALENVRCSAGGYGRNDQGYDAPQSGYGSRQPSYSPPQPGYSTQQPGYSTPSSGYPSQPGYGGQSSMRAANKLFRYPTVRGYAVDRCLHWGVDCGKPAADEFCAQNGFRGASQFDVVMKRPTMVLGENQVCNRSDCTGFSSITCSN